MRILERTIWHRGPLERRQLEEVWVRWFIAEARNFTKGILCSRVDGHGKNFQFFLSLETPHCKRLINWGHLSWIWSRGYNSQNFRLIKYVWFFLFFLFLCLTTPVLIWWKLRVHCEHEDWPPSYLPSSSWPITYLNFLLTINFILHLQMFLRTSCTMTALRQKDFKQLMRNIREIHINYKLKGFTFYCSGVQAVY